MNFNESSRGDPEQTIRPLIQDNRGLSEIAGYTVVFALIIGTISITLALGVPGVTSVQEDESETAIDRSFDRLDDSVANVDHRTANQTARIFVPDGELRPASSPDQIRIEQRSGGTVDRAHTFESSPLVFTPDEGDQEVIYASGTRGTIRGSQVTVREGLTTTPSQSESDALVLHAREVAFTNHDTAITGPTYPQYFITQPPNSPREISSFDEASAVTTVEIEITTSFPEYWAAILRQTPGTENIAVTGAGGGGQATVEATIEDGTALRLVVTPVAIEQLI